MAAQAEPSDRILTVPNLLSLLRLLCVPLFAWLIVRHHDGVALLVLALSGFTDYLDGFLARRWNQVSRLGQLLDPFADRLYILATVLGLAWRGVIPWWLTILLLTRDVMLAATLPVLRHYGFGPLPVHLIGKSATFNLLYAFPLLLLGVGSSTLAAIARPIGWAFAGWGVGLYWWAGLLYVWQTRQVVRHARRPPGSEATRVRR